MKKTCTALWLLSAALLIGAGPAHADGPIPISFPEPSPVDPELGQPARVEGPVTLKVQGRGCFLSMNARSTNVPDEYLVRADDADLDRLAETFEARINWQPRTGTLSCIRGMYTRSIRIGQNRVQIPIDAGPSGSNAGTQGAELNVPAQNIEGVPYIPISALEEFFDARITVRGKELYVEPLIRSVAVESDHHGGSCLKIDASAPVGYKTFRLHNPERYVVDVAGGVLDTPALTVTDPNVGTIRLGQFELGPATSRIVIPIAPGVHMSGPARGQGQTIELGLGLPSTVPVAVPGDVAHIGKVGIDDAGHLTIVSDRPLHYASQRFPDNRYVIDIRGAMLSGPKSEVPLDDPRASAFRIAQYAPQPTPVVRVVVDLKGASTVDLRASDSGLMLALVDKTPLLAANPITPATLTPTAPPDSTETVVSGSGSGGVIVIDPGHGGSDPGAENHAIGINEATVTLDVAKRLATLLRSRGWTVILTRNTNVDVTYWGSSARTELQGRSDVANRNHADVFVSIHCNASANPAGNGTSIHYYKQGDYRLARDLQASLLSATGRTSRGLQANRFYVLAHTTMPAVLVETAFVTNPQEGSLLADPAYRERVAEGLAAGLGTYAAHCHGWASARR